MPRGVLARLVLELFQHSGAVLGEGRIREPYAARSQRLRAPRDHADARRGLCGGREGNATRRRARRFALSARARDGQSTESEASDAARRVDASVGRSVPARGGRPPAMDGRRNGHGRKTHGARPSLKDHVHPRCRASAVSPMQKRANRRWTSFASRAQAVLRSLQAFASHRPPHIRVIRGKDAGSSPPVARQRRVYLICR